MSERQKYVKRPDQTVNAVRLDLDTDGFSYVKWGGRQQCKPGDWIVNAGDETYTVDADTFARTYRHVRDGAYLKVTPVWAEPAAKPGTVPTKEGASQYQAGDYLVSNQEDGGDLYAVAKATFERIYEPAR
jgi:hypothetical protein